MYDLEPMSDEELRTWDELISPYSCRQIFHREAWLRYLAISRDLTIRRWTIRERGRTIGYFPAGVMKRGPYSVLGSPLRGWGSSMMGPIAGEDFDPDRFVDALGRLARDENFAMIQIESPLLADGLMERYGFECETNQTYVVDLTPEDPDIMWRRIQKTTRNRIRFAGKRGVVVEDTNKSSIARELYDGWTEIAARRTKGRSAPPYDFRAVQLMFDCLKAEDMIFALRVCDSEGNSIASGFFPHDDRAVCFALTGNRKAFFDLCPNDVLQWTVMSLAAARGIRTYDMYGYGFFKAKFGGTLRIKKRWHKYYHPSARLARWTYERYFIAQDRVRSLISKVKGQPTYSDSAE